jgi:hypothetical protein
MTFFLMEYSIAFKKILIMCIHELYRLAVSISNDVKV